ncbi:MAG: methionine--tRNA ligase, partial [Rickettsiales bacterium]
WLDALTNYITAVGHPNTQDSLWSYWPANLHMVGKDILRFHTVYWPAFLMAAGIAPPQRVFAHGWWTNEGQKISKSVGNVIDPFELVERYGLDPVRYFLMRQVPFGNDGDFSHQAMVHRLNGDLANDLGNLCQRVLSMVFRNCDGKIPQKHQLTKADEAFVANVSGSINDLRMLMETQAFHQALELIWRHVAEANRYVDEQAPWELRKSNPPRMESVLYVLVEVIRNVAILTTPFMPDSMEKVFVQLGVAEDGRGFGQLGLDHALAPGTPLAGKPVPIFPRFVDEDEG